MRWNSKKGMSSTDERTIKRFTLWPEQCKLGHMHWLEKVTIRQFWGVYSGSWCDRPEYIVCPDEESK